MQRSILSIDNCGSYQYSRTFENETMKTQLRRLTMAAALLSTSIASPAVSLGQSLAGNDADYFQDFDTRAEQDIDPEGSIRQVSTSMYVGDEVTQAAHQPAPIGSTAPASQPTRSAQSAVRPAAQRRAAAPRPSAQRAPRGRIGSVVYDSRPDTWLTAEMLLWFPQARSTPPLGVGNASGQLPVIGAEGAVIDGDSFGNGLAPGFRADVGRYFGDGTFGIGGRVWVLGNDRDRQSFAGDGSDVSFGIPFFNTAVDGGQAIGEDAVIVGFNDGNLSVEGQADAVSRLSIVAAELYGRALLGQSRNHRLELLGGYSFFKIEDDLTLNTHAVTLQPQPITATAFSDHFRTRNEFHGGQIGGEFTLQRGRWTASSLTKVHLGTMAQRVAVAGSSGSALAPDPVEQNVDQGLFARGSAQGERRRDVFAFAPEVNLKLGYQFRERVNLHVGYTFVYWSNVALAGEQMDRSLHLDGSDLGEAGPERYSPIRSVGYWVQGIDLGATVTF